MTRLIDADALKKAFDDTICIEPIQYAFVKQIIDNAPTITSDLDDKVIIAHERIAYERGVSDGYAEALEEFKAEQLREKALDSSNIVKPLNDNNEE